MIKVGPEKRIYGRAIAVRVSGDGRAGGVVVARGGWVVRKTKDAVRAGRGEVLEDLRIIATGRVIAVGDPPEIVEIGKLTDQRDVRAGNPRGLRFGAGQSATGR